VQLALSIVLVFGALGVFVGNAMLSEQGELGFGYEQMIHARIPWLLLSALFLGSGLGLWSLVRARRWYKWAIVPIEVAVAILLTVYFTNLSFLPEHRLAVSIGDRFPSYELPDQDGELHTFRSTANRPALYIFYRGDW
jgi:hypothetical protein